jgi:hypothetical protein
VGDDRVAIQPACYEIEGAVFERLDRDRNIAPAGYGLTPEPGNCQRGV